VLHLILFISEDVEAAKSFKFDFSLSRPVIYIMLTNIFEIIFFFAFLRYFVEKSFGIIPAIILSAIFYSLHHAGFQPEFGKLFVVGIVYISFYRIVNHWLIMFPLWWICALYDVLIRSTEIDDISKVSWIQIVIIFSALLFSYIWMILLNKRKQSA